MRKRYSIILVLALVLCACAKNGPEVENKEIRFNVFHPSALTKATETSFEISDKIGVYMTAYDGDTPLALQPSGNQVNNSCLEYDGHKWISNPKMYWNGGEKYDVYAYYPYANPQSTDEYVFDLSLDQNTERSDTGLGGYEASDLLWAKAKGVSYPNAVNLTFRHILSRLVVNIVRGENFEGDMPEDVELRIHSTVPRAVVDLSNGIVVKDRYAEAQTIKAKKIGDYRFEAILVPQTLAFRLPLVEVIANKVSYLVEMRMDFKQGMSHSISVVLDEDPAKVKIEIGGEIQEWN